MTSSVETGFLLTFGNPLATTMKLPLLSLCTLVPTMPTQADVKDHIGSRGEKCNGEIGEGERETEEEGETDEIPGIQS